MANIQITLNDEQIPQRKTVKYLGIHLQANMKFNNQTTEALKKAKNVTSRLWRMIGPYSKLSLVNKLTIYKLFTRSALTYNIHLWYETSKTNRKRIQTYQNKIIRMCMNLRPDPISFRQVRNTTIHQICNIPTIVEFYKRIKNKFIEGCKNHNNETIKSFFPHTND